MKQHKTLLLLALAFEGAIATEGSADSPLEDDKRLP